MILGHFLPFYPPETHHPFANVYQKSQSYDKRFLRYRVRQKEAFVILDHIFPFYPHNDPKNQILEKRKKLPEDIIILHMLL